MSGKRYVLTAAALAFIAVAGCSSSSSSSAPNAGTATRTPVASSSAIANAKAEATACIQKTGTSGLITSSGRTELANCLKGVVPPAEQQAFKTCITSAAVNDKVWTSDGRSKFTNTSVPGCLDTAASATASPT
jgi:energy-coupling factor transporter ATP-binding protein EcfA2